MKMRKMAAKPAPNLAEVALMTTGETADYLRVKERTIYEMVARHTIPFTRATGKLLFPRRLIDAWLASTAQGR